MSKRIQSLLMWATRNRPMKTIEIDGKPYLHRYYMGQILGRQFWLHRFLTADSERHQHTHPWSATSVILSGGYLEERSGELFRCAAVSVNRIEIETLHRIAEVMPDTWTLMVVGKARRTTWRFVGDDGATVLMAASDRDWWKRCGVRRG